jgi:CO dehydrogenase/acetyl-CoA synthase gamma subunit (corrinoid Fe-S protein)
MSKLEELVQELKEEAGMEEGKSDRDVVVLGGRAARLALDFIEKNIGWEDMTGPNKAKLLRRLEQAIKPFMDELQRSWKGLSR